MIRLPAWARGQRRGRHRVDSQLPHRGWEGREGELRLLAEDPAATTPIRGLPFLPTVEECPIDQCEWRSEEPSRGDDFALLEHWRQYHRGPIENLSTMIRLRSAVIKLQEQQQ